MTLAGLLTRAAEAAASNEWATAAAVLADVPLSNEVLDRRGWYRSRAKLYDEAIADFEQLRARRPHDYLPPYMIGYQYYQQERWSEAITYFDEALSHAPDHVRSLWRRAHALHRLGRESEAIVGAGRVLRAWHALPKDRQHADRHLLAKASHLIARHQIKRDPGGAVDLLRQAVKHEPDDPYHHYQLAKALRRSGDPHAALASAEAARRLKPNDANIELEYVDALVATELLSDAARSLRRVHRRCSGWVAYRAGTLAMKAGEARLAIDLLRRAVNNPQVRGEPQVQQALKDALIAAGNSADDVPESQLMSSAPSLPGAGRRHRPRERRRLALAATNTATSAQSGEGSGTVDLIRDDRNFGFLVDDSGVRRHFRLPDTHTLQKGERVTFTPTTAPKGPAAQNVRSAQAN